jgi:hypothetical protein
MKDFLSNFIAKNRNPADKKIQERENIFIKTSELIIKLLGEKPFVLTRGLNVAIFDSVFTTTAQNLGKIQNIRFREKFKMLLVDKEFIKSVTSATTDEVAVKNRFDRCKYILLGK